MIEIKTLHTFQFMCKNSTEYQMLTGRKIVTLIWSRHRISDSIFIPVILESNKGSGVEVRDGENVKCTSCVVGGPAEG